MNQRIRVPLPLAACAALALAVTAPMASADEGLRVVRDATTGQLRAPTAAEARLLQPRAGVPRGVLSGKVSPQPRRLSNGTRVVELTQDQMTYSVATRRADGTIDMNCVPNAEQAELIASGQQPVSFAQSTTEHKHEEK